MIFALLFAMVLFVLAVFSIRRPIRYLSRVRFGSPLPSDDRTYLRNQAYRRLITGILMLALAAMLGGAYFSDFERRADEFGQQRRADEKGQRPPPGPEEKDFFRTYAMYWISVLVLLFLVVSLAIVDLWSTRRYAWQQLRRIGKENRAMLERDLAMHRQQTLNDRMHRS